MKYPTAPGVFDIIPTDEQNPWKSSSNWQFIEEIIYQITNEYGFQQIRTPLFERTELFQRTVGESSDIVSKEMYTFLDKGGRSLSLRPEGTAPVMRAYIEHGLQHKALAQKLFYIGPMFRYERAQAGRYRQHHQFGVEVVGQASAAQDAELLAMLYHFYKRLGLKKVTLHLNSIGTNATRMHFRQALQDFLRPHLPTLSTDSQTRFETNPLRILDSKDANDRLIIANAPSILDFLDDETRAHFEEVQSLLKLIGIAFNINPQLVRGLDYYNKTVFEFTSGELGAQNSLGGGGRYDGLIAALGGPDLQAIGFGTGIERILQAMINEKISFPKAACPLIFLVAMGPEANTTCFKLLNQLREHHIAAQMDFNFKKVGKSLQLADQLSARFVAVIGDQELQSGQIEIKELSTGNKTAVALSDLIETLLKIKSREVK